MPTSSAVGYAHISGQTHGPPAGAADDLLTVAAGVWLPVTGMAVTLPEAGTYLLTADVRAAIVGQPPVNGYVLARLFNVTAGAAIPDSVRIVVQALDSSIAGAAPFADQTTAPIAEQLTIMAPTVIRLEAAWNFALGLVTVANVTNLSTTGRCRLAYERIR